MKSKSTVLLTLALVVLPTALATLGCKANSSRPEPSGSRLWGETCARCHNSRPPNSFTDDEWDVIAHHMRVRANLTGEQHRAILAFLKQGS